MSRAAVERKLREVNVELRLAREELAVLNEQAAHFVLEADPADRDAERHAEVHVRSRDRLAARVQELEQSRDDLLDRLVLESR
jgi:hypothetical protein